MPSKFQVKITGQSPIFGRIVLVFTRADRQFVDKGERSRTAVCRIGNRGGQGGRGGRDSQGRRGGRDSRDSRDSRSNRSSQGCCSSRRGRGGRGSRGDRGGRSGHGKRRGHNSRDCQDCCSGDCSRGRIHVKLHKHPANGTPGRRTDPRQVRQKKPGRGQMPEMLRLRRRKHHGKTPAAARKPLRSPSPRKAAPRVRPCRITDPTYRPKLYCLFQFLRLSDQFLCATRIVFLPLPRFCVPPDGTPNINQTNTS